MPTNNTLSLQVLSIQRQMLPLASESFPHAIIAKIVLVLSCPFWLKEVSAAITLYLINPFRLKEQKPSLNLGFNFRIILPRPSILQQSLSLLQAFVFENFKESTSSFSLFLSLLVRYKRNFEDNSSIYLNQQQ